MALRRRAQRGYCGTSSDCLRTNCAHTCGSTCEPAAVHQSTNLHRAPREDFRALFSVQSAAQLKLWQEARPFEYPTQAFNNQCNERYSQKNGDPAKGQRLERNTSCWESKTRLS